MSDGRFHRALQLFQQAYRSQMRGELERAVDQYQASLEEFPTAEAHTFLGWAYYAQGKPEEAIAQCKRATEIDPDFGNPYNDIGSYLISLQRYDEAIPWLEHAICAPRYDPRHYPYFNLGRAYLAKGMIDRARQYFQESLRIEPRYALARQAVENLRRMVN